LDVGNVGLEAGKRFGGGKVLVLGETACFLELAFCRVDRGVRRGEFGLFLQKCGLLLGETRNAGFQFLVVAGRR
jgi:hypothetical protein